MHRHSPIFHESSSEEILIPVPSPTTATTNDNGVHSNDAVGRVNRFPSYNAASEGSSSSTRYTEDQDTTSLLGGYSHNVKQETRHQNWLKWFRRKQRQVSRWWLNRVRHYGRSSRTNSKISANSKFITTLSLHILGTTSYLFSLEGGSLDYVKSILSKLGIFLAISILCFIVLVYRAAASTPAFNRHYHLLRSQHFYATKLTYAAIIVNVLLLYLFDSGESFEHHGAYNILIFMLVLVPVTTILFTSLALYKYSRTLFRVISLSLILLFTLYATITLSHSRANWAKGLVANAKTSITQTYGDTSRKTVQLCPLEPHWPVFDLLPNGMMNIWAGGRTCPKNKMEWSSTIDNDGVLQITGCPFTSGDGALGPKYAIVPDTRDWDITKKGRFLMGKASRPYYLDKRMTYHSPVFVGKDTEAVVTECGEEQQIVYRLQRRKAATDETAESDHSKKLDTDTATTAQTPPTSSPTDPNILVIYIDAVSRSLFKRKLPLTSRMIRTIHSTPTSNAHEFFRYSLSGFNTDPNTRVMWSGHLRPPGDAQPIWKDFKQHGWVTGFSSSDCEDWSGTYLARTVPGGFDHENIATSCNPRYFLSGDGENPFGNFIGPYSVRARCLYGGYVHESAIRYMNQFIDTYHGHQKFFGFLNLIEGHEGTGEVLMTIDQHLSEFLQSLYQRGILKDTIVMILSDHGPHMSLNYLYLANGKVDHASPMMAMLVPQELSTPSTDSSNEDAKAHGEAMNWNEQMVVAAGDIYRYLKSWAVGGKGLDGLGVKVDPARGCRGAGVPDEYCWCKTAI